jgi:hypothetical protein
MRKRTNSLTELCKEITREIVEERLELHIINEHTSKKPESKSYTAWSKEEDEQLYSMFELFLAEASLKHRRTIGAIRCRIQQKLSLNKDRQ